MKTKEEILARITKLQSDIVELEERGYGGNIISGIKQEIEVLQWVLN